mgnify:FL=1
MSDLLSIEFSRDEWLDKLLARCLPLDHQGGLKKMQQEENEMLMKFAYSTN